MVMRKQQKTLDKELLKDARSVVYELEDEVDEVKLKLKDCSSTLRDGKELDEAQRSFLKYIKGGWYK
jgi:2-hydroxy-3-keto-5-methylthiopentenyl-1-phosphate phosphatase